MWPAEVTGCAAVVERLVLPPGADAEIPEDPAAAAGVRREHPDRAGGADRRRRDPRRVRRTVRCGCAPTTTTSRWSAGADLVPGLLELLAATLAGRDRRAAG